MWQYMKDLWDKIVNYGWEYKPIKSGKCAPKQGKISRRNVKKAVKAVRNRRLTYQETGSFEEK